MTSTQLIKRVETMKELLGQAVHEANLGASHLENFGNMAHVLKGCINALDSLITHDDEVRWGVLSLAKEHLALNNPEQMMEMASSLRSLAARIQALE